MRRDKLVKISVQTIERKIAQPHPIDPSIIGMFFPDHQSCLYQLFDPAVSGAFGNTGRRANGADTDLLAARLQAVEQKQDIPGRVRKQIFGKVSRPEASTSVHAIGKAGPIVARLRSRNGLFIHLFGELGKKPPEFANFAGIELTRGTRF